jgi:hypothetical protein
VIEVVERNEEEEEEYVLEDNFKPHKKCNLH